MQKKVKFTHQLSIAMRKSAGILLYRYHHTTLQVLLVHPGGPFWTNKDEGAWTIPKGEFTDEEEPLHAAQREFHEETGHTLQGNFTPLTPVKQKGGKLVYAWAIEGDIDAAAIVCTTFKMQWPPNSGQWKTYAEVDKAGWFTIPEARIKINTSQVAFIDELLSRLQ